MKLGLRHKLVETDFNSVRTEEGDIQFPSSSMSDNFIVKAINAISAHIGESVADITTYINLQIKQRDEMTAVAPLLYSTLHANAAEQEVFSLFWKTNTPSPGAPTFSEVTFYDLMYAMQGEYDNIFPLRSYIDRRRVTHPNIHFLGGKDTDVKAAGTTGGNTSTDAKAKSDMGISTAAAAPDGHFYFNRNFMQALMNYSHLKGVVPKGKKYKSNGGRFPDEYAWIEFVIMHEFMHYTDDDFYYQRKIPNANPKIINWVGDFRTNFFLTKSGFEPLPMGLFNDKINFDRQRTYAEMYRLVEEEFKKLNAHNQEKLSQMMDGMSDNHEKGNEQGANAEPGDIEGVTADDLDANARENEGKLNDKGDENGQSKPGQQKDPIDQSQEHKRVGGKMDSYQIDYSKIQPRFNWKVLVDRFIRSGLKHTEETYAKPHRRSISSMDIARQVGAAAMKPAERPLDMSDAKLMFILDNSGSMTHVIEIVIANAMKLLKMPMFKKATILCIKFSGSSDLYKVNVGGNKAGKIEKPGENPSKWDKRADEVLSSHVGGGTELTPEMVTQVTSAMALGYNVILFTDDNIMWTENYMYLSQMIKAAPSQMFVVFDAHKAYVEFRKKTGINTNNISYFK